MCVCVCVYVMPFSRKKATTHYIYNSGNDDLNTSDTHTDWIFFWNCKSFFLFVAEKKMKQKNFARTHTHTSFDCRFIIIIIIIVCDLDATIMMMEIISPPTPPQ